MGSSYKEATNNNNVLYYKLHGLVSIIMKIVKFYKPNQILILFFSLAHRSLSTLHYFQLKKKQTNSKTNHAVKNGSAYIYNLVDIEAKKTKEIKTGNLSIKYNLDSAMKIFFTWVLPVRLSL